MIRPSFFLPLALVLAALALSACETVGGADVGDLGQDASADVPVVPDATDVALDVALDVAADVPEAQDLPADRGPDVPDPTDVALDPGPDAPDPTDVALDAGPDALDAGPDSSDSSDVPADSVPDATAISCGGAEPFFPEFSKACAGLEDCAYGLHQTDCCGNRVAVGLAGTEVAAFAAAETTCRAQYPHCGCPQGPIVAEDGVPAFDEADVRVDCVGGACQTFVAPCALVKPFEWANSCAVDADCALALHQVNCCGTFVAWGVSASEAPGFATAEAACEASYPHCGCASKPTVAQDGNEGGGTETFGVACQQGACRSFVVGADPRCRTPADCPSGQMCLAPGESLPCGMCYEPENTCASDPDCPEGAVCELVTGGCACYAATQCIPACNLPASLACAVGQTCAANGHCVDTPCSADADCPWLFACVGGEAPVCGRKACSVDDECGGGRCVEGACHDQLGSCLFPPP